MEIAVTEEELDEFFNVCSAILENASQVVVRGFYAAKEVQTKSCHTDLVTATDQEVEKLIIGKLKENFPDHRFIGEETTATGVKNELTNAPTWIIDPVDGTMNFIHSVPLVAISVGLWINKKPCIGFIVNPVLKQTYSARAGKGSFCNGEPIKVSGLQDLSQALIATEMGTSTDPKKLSVVLENLSTFLGHCHGTRSLGAAALNMASVATGSFDAYYEFGLHAWDMAAGALLIEEAGGTVIDTTGGPFDLMSRRVVCAASEKLAHDIATRLRQYELERD